MANQLQYEIVTKEGGEQFILLYELGKEQTPLALIPASEVNRWAYQLQQDVRKQDRGQDGTKVFVEMDWSPSDYATSIRIVSPANCPKHIWSPVHIWLDGYVVATHNCVVCGQLGYKDFYPNDSIYVVDFTCERCQTVFATELWKMKCPRCGHDNLPF